MGGGGQKDSLECFFSGGIVGDRGGKLGVNQVFKEGGGHLVGMFRGSSLHIYDAGGQKVEYSQNLQLRLMV